MRRRKIILAVTKGNWGGAQRYVYDLATGLAPERFEVVVVCGAGEILPAKLAAAGVRVSRLPRLGREVSFWDDLASFRHFWQLLRREQPDLVHLNSPKISGLGALACRLSGRKSIITIHGWAFNEKRPRWQKILIWLFSYLTSLLAHRVITITASELAQGQAMPGLKNKLRLIPNGAAEPSFLPRDEARLKLDPGQPSDELWIGVMAELHPNKGLTNLIAALRELAAYRWRAIIIGEGEERAKLEHLIQETGLSNRLKLTGFVPEAAAYLKAFDIFVLPSLKEGLPYALLEAGWAKLPVVASAVGGIPEILDGGRAGRLVPPGEPAALAAALQTLLHQPALRQELGETLRQRVREKYSRERLLAQVTELYEAER
jgi:glycosyltransferase involved in cell wall biosynthesis